MKYPATSVSVQFYGTVSQSITKVGIEGVETVQF